MLQDHEVETPNKNVRVLNHPHSMELPHGSDRLDIPEMTVAAQGDLRGSLGHHPTWRLPFRTVSLDETDLGFWRLAQVG